eukprot:4370866-Amphidinium_carterae.2
MSRFKALQFWDRHAMIFLSIESKGVQLMNVPNCNGLEGWRVGRRRYAGTRPGSTRPLTSEGIYATVRLDDKQAPSSSVGQGADYGLFCAG